MAIYSDKTYDNLMEQALERVPDTLDKREGSMLWNGNAPCLAEVAQLYAACDFVFDATFVLTAPREFLIRRAADRSLYPKAATPAVYKVLFNMNVPIGSRFSCEEYNFVVTEHIEDYAYKLEAETAGEVCNSFTANDTLIPIEYISGLTTCTIDSLLIAGENEEDTEVFRQRVIEAMRSEAFGGNQTDYKQKILEIDGTSQCKIYPVWTTENYSPADLIPNETVAEWYESFIESASDDVKEWLNAVYDAASNRKLTVGGTVKAVILGNSPTNNYVPDDEVIEEIQEKVDPQAGEGLGLAPIGHVVNVVPVTAVPLSIGLDLTFKTGSFADYAPRISEVINEYFETLIKGWANSEKLIVRTAYIESKILEECADFVTDIGEHGHNTQIGGFEGNHTLSRDEIPALGVLTDLNA